MSLAAAAGRPGPGLVVVWCLVLLVAVLTMALVVSLWLAWLAVGDLVAVEAVAERMRALCGLAPRVP